MSETATKKIGGQDRVVEPEAVIASLTKQNNKLKNELKFTKETERRASGDIVTLKRDLESLQSRNEQISSALMHAELQLKTNEISQAKVDAASSAKQAAHSAALVERLSSAQRERERVLASQLRKVMDEKQQLLKRLKDSGEDLSSDQNDDTDEAASETSDLVHLADALQTASNAFELQQGGDKLVKRLKEVQDERMKGIQSKVDMLKQESQEARAKKEIADERIVRLKRQLEMLKTEYKLVDKTRIKALQAQLQTAVSERNNWHKKAEKFEDACETLRVLSSLQRSMSKETEIQRKFEGELLKCHQEIEHLTKQSSQIIQERNQLVEERRHLIQQAQEEYERAERLQRLVIVLRRKVINSSGSLNNSERLESSPVYDI